MIFINNTYKVTYDQLSKAVDAAKNGSIQQLKSVSKELLNTLIQDDDNFKETSVELIDLLIKEAFPLLLKANEKMDYYSYLYVFAKHLEDNQNVSGIVQLNNLMKNGVYIDLQMYRLSIASSLNKFVSSEDFDNSSSARFVNIFGIYNGFDVIIKVLEYLVYEDVVVIFEFLSISSKWLLVNYREKYIKSLQSFFNLKKELPILVYRYMKDFSTNTTQSLTYDELYISKLYRIGYKEDLTEELRYIVRLPEISQEIVTHLLDLFFKKVIGYITDYDLLEDFIKFFKAKNIESFNDKLYKAISGNISLLNLFFNYVKDYINPNIGYYINHKRDETLAIFLLKLMTNFEQNDIEKVENVLKIAFHYNNETINEMFFKLINNKWIHPSFNKVISEIILNYNKDYDLSIICPIINITKPDKDFPYMKLSENILEYLNSTDIALHFQKYSFLPTDNLIEQLFEYIQHDNWFYEFLEKRCLNQINQIEEELIKCDTNSKEYCSLLWSSYKQFNTKRNFLYKLISLQYINEEIINSMNHEIKNDPILIRNEILNIINNNSFKGFKFMLKHFNINQININDLNISDYKGNAKSFLMLLTNDNLNTNDLIELFNGDIFDIEIGINKLNDQNIDNEILLNVYKKCCQENNYNFCEKLSKLIKIETINEDFIDKCIINTNQNISELSFNLLNENQIQENLTLFKPVLISNNSNLIMNYFDDETKIELLKHYIKTFTDVNEFNNVFQQFLYNILSTPENIQSLWEIYFSSDFPSFLRNKQNNESLFGFVSTTTEMSFFDKLIKTSKIEEFPSIRPKTNSSILQILSSFQCIMKNINKFSKEIQESLSALYFNTNNQIISKIDNFRLLPVQILRHFEIFYININNEYKSETFLNVSPINSVQESIELFYKYYVIMNSPEIISLTFNSQLQNDFVLNEFLDISTFSIYKTKYILRSILCSDGNVYIKHKNSYIKCDKDSTSLVNNIPLNSINFIYYEKYNEKDDNKNEKLKIYRKVQNKNINFQYILQQFLNNKTNEWNFDRTEDFYKYLFELTYSYKLNNTFDTFINDKKASEYFFENDVSIPYLTTTKNIFKEQIIKLSVNYEDIAGLIFLLSEIDNVNYELVFDIINYNIKRIPNQTKIDLISFFNINEIIQINSFSEFCTNIFTENDPKELIQKNKQLLEFALKLSKEEYIKYLPKPIPKEIMELSLKYSTPEFLMLLLEQNPKPEYVQMFSTKLYNSTKFIELLKQMKDNKELKSNTQWIKELLMQDDIQKRKEAFNLMKIIWPNNINEKNKNITNLLYDCLKTKKNYYEMLNIIIYYSDWFDNSNITLLYINYLISQKPTKIPHYLEFCDSLLSFPAIQSFPFTEELIYELVAGYNEDDHKLICVLLFKLMVKNPLLFNIFKTKFRFNAYLNKYNELVPMLDAILNGINENNFVELSDFLKLFVPKRSSKLIEFLEQITKKYKIIDTTSCYIVYIEICLYCLHNSRNIINDNEKKTLIKCCLDRLNIISRNKFQSLAKVNYDQTILKILTIFNMSLIDFLKLITNKEVKIQYFKLLEMLSLSNLKTIKNVIKIILYGKYIDLIAPNEWVNFICNITGPMFTKSDKAIYLFVNQLSYYLSTENCQFATIEPFVKFMTDTIAKQPNSTLKILESLSKINIVRLLEVPVNKDEVTSYSRFFIQLLTLVSKEKQHLNSNFFHQQTLIKIINDLEADNPNFDTKINVLYLMLLKSKSEISPIIPYIFDHLESLADKVPDNKKYQQFFEKIIEQLL